MDEKQAREAYELKFGTLSDEDWAEAAKDVTDWDAFVANLETSAEAEAAEAEAKAAAEAAAKAEADAAEAKAKTESDTETPEEGVIRLSAELAARDVQLAESVAAREAAQTELAASQAAAREVTVRAEIAATQFGTGLPTPAAVEILLPLRLEPNEANAQAVFEYLKANGGMLPTFIPGESAGLTATNAEGNDEEAWLEGKPITDHAKARTREIAAAQSIGLKAAYREYCIEVNKGQ